MPSSTASRGASAARSFALAETERRSAVASGAQADRHEAAGWETCASLEPLRFEAVAFHRAEQGRHHEIGRLQQAYGEHLLEPAEAGPALVLAIGSLIGEVDLALHLVSARGVTLASGATHGTGASCRDLEGLLGEGPGTRAVQSGAVVTEQTETSARWPAFTPAALDLGVRTVIAVPLRPAGAAAGAVTIYSTEALHVGAAATRLIPVLSSTLVRLLLDDQVAGTTHALGSGQLAARVHQATGVIASRRGCTIDDALALLRARAFVDDVSVLDLAGRIVMGSSSLD